MGELSCPGNLSKVPQLQPSSSHELLPRQVDHLGFISPWFGLRRRASTHVAIGKAPRSWCADVALHRLKSCMHQILEAEVSKRLACSWGARKALLNIGPTAGDPYQTRQGNLPLLQDSTTHLRNPVQLGKQSRTKILVIIPRYPRINPMSVVQCYTWPDLFAVILHWGLVVGNF